MQISERDHALVTAAVSAAEKTTDGEIVTIVAGQSDSYLDVVLHWSMLVMFLVLALIAFRPDILTGLRGLIDGGWRHDYPMGELLTVLLLLLATSFLIARLIIGWTPLRMALTPRAVKARRVRRRALSCFSIGIEHQTKSRTGVLLYLSLGEHQAEIIADAAIAAKVAPEIWGEAMAVMIDAVRDGRPGEGMAAAVERIGAVLAEHFPHSGSDPNELPDRLVTL
jgi:putative membrane protein